MPNKVKCHSNYGYPSNFKFNDFDDSYGSKKEQKRANKEFKNRKRKNERKRYGDDKFR